MKYECLKWARERRAKLHQVVRLCSVGIFTRISLRTSITQHWLGDRIRISVVLLLLLFNELRAGKVHHVSISRFSTSTNFS